MSGGGNPYAVNGYQSTNAVNSNVQGRYGGINGQQADHSSSSVSSFASRERRRRDEAPNPYAIEESPQPTYARQRYAGGSEDYERRPSTGSQELVHNDSSRMRDIGRRPVASNGYRHHSPRRNARSIEEVLQHIQNNWNDMSGDECIPVQIALKLMDESSLGLGDKVPDFEQTHLDLQKTLKAIVNEHHQDFNSSIGTYHKIQASIQNSQARVRYLKQALAGAQTGLLTTKPELKGLATSSQHLDDTLQLFGQIESLHAVPERLEARISEKRFLTAVDVLQEALRLVRKSDLDEIGAVTDLRSYFTNQEQSLTDILIEELHDHLYLKSPYCQDRWKAKNAEGVEQDVQAAMTGTGFNPWDKPVFHYLSTLDTKTPMAEDSSRNPEVDTFYYIHMIIESLNKLGRMEDAVQRIEQRMPIELYKVVEKTNIDIDARDPGHLRGWINRDEKRFITMQATDGRGAVLSNFLWTLYSKFEAVADGHRVLHEVVAGIALREQFAKPERYTGGFKELWKLYQMEMRSLLHDYLATDRDLIHRSGLSNTAGGDVFARNQRDRSKKMFKLAEMDQKSSGVKGEQEELDEILKASVPGLVSKSRGKTGNIASSERPGHDSSAAGHKLLVEPSVFNMTILLPPSLTFLQRLKDIVPVSSSIPMSTLTSFLDDFLINIFHPQLEEAVTELCRQSMIDLEAFSEDSHWSKHSPYPVFKGTIAFMSLITAFSGMLSSIPQDQIFTQLIISQLSAYSEKCVGYYKAMVSRLAPSPSAPNTNVRVLKAAAAYAESGEIHDVAANLLPAQVANLASSDRSVLVEKAERLLLSTIKSSPLSAYDIISDPRTVHHLSLLHNSMRWLSSSLSHLRHVDISMSSRSNSRHSRNPSQSRRWTLVSNLKSHSKAASAPVQLPLNPESAALFDETLASFRTLADTALLTLHIDIRCGIIHQVSRSMRGTEAEPALSIEPSSSTMDVGTALEPAVTPYRLPQPPTSASPLILDLNNDLISFDTNISTYLGSKQRQFIITGLGSLVDRLFVAGATWIGGGVMNANGCQRIMLDGVVLSVGLRNISAGILRPSNKDEMGAKRGVGSVIPDGQANDDDEGGLSSSQQYYNLFLAGPAAILDYVKARKLKRAKEPDSGDIDFSYDELRTLLELCYSESLTGEDREQSMKAKKNMGESLLRLGELMWDS